MKLYVQLHSGFEWNCTFWQFFWNSLLQFNESMVLLPKWSTFVSLATSLQATFVTVLPWNKTPSPPSPILVVKVTWSSQKTSGQFGGSGQHFMWKAQSWALNSCSSMMMALVFFVSRSFYSITCSALHIYPSRDRVGGGLLCPDFISPCLPYIGTTLAQCP